MLGIGIKIKNSNINSSSKIINLTGTGSDVSNYILRLNVHYGINVWDFQNSDVYCNKKCKTDFSDIVFKDINGNTLNHYLASSGNYEFVNTATQAGRDTIVYNGAIYSVGITDKPYNYLYKSINNGNNWTLLYSGTSAVHLVFIDSRGYIFITENKILKRSVDDGQTWATVLDMTTAGTGADILPQAFDEDTNGNLFFGRYQDALNSAIIYKSTDGGANWTTSWSSASKQHVHGLKVDRTNNYVYAGVDNGATSIIIRTINGGTDWTTLYTGPDGNTNSFYCGDGFRLCGAEAHNGVSILKTTDDITFTSCLSTGQTILDIQAQGSNIYAFGVSKGNNQYPTIYLSTDSGTNWKTIWIGEYDSGSFAGYFYWFRNFATPTGAGERSLQSIGGGNNGINSYANARLYSGSDHYQALFYIEIPTLPAAGTTIILNYGKTGSSKITIFSQSQAANLFARYKLDEGTGTIINDSSGNLRNGTVAFTTGSWQAFNGRRSGQFYPDIVNIGSCLKNTCTVTITNSGTNAAWQFVKNFTACCWIKNTGGLGVSQHILGKGSWDNGWQMEIYGGSNYLSFHNKDKANSRDYHYSIYNEPGGNGVLTGLCDSLWHFVAVIVDNATPANVSFFIDGRLYDAQAMNYDCIVTTKNVTFMKNSEGDAAFAGYIDDVQFYSVALTEAQLRCLYEDRSDITKINVIQ